MQVYLQRARDPINRMMHLLEEVLIVGQAEAGKLRCLPSPMPLEAFCCRLVEDFQVVPSSTAPKHTIVFTQTGDVIDREALFNLDENLLRHMLTNLLSNAIKYSPNGGIISFNLACAAESVTFQIRDCGIGIPRRDVEQLFNRFHRASNAQTIPGTGLGLSIVKECVDAHGGNITVESEMGIGTAFTITLPIF